MVRAKRTLSAANIRFELPSPAERPARLAAVREVIYLVFNEGYSATSGDLWMRTDLCAEALGWVACWPARTPHDTESLGLLALMELQASRLKARTGPGGEPVLLMDQDRTRWDHLLIRRGLATIERIDQLGGTAGPTPCRPRSPPATREPALPRTPTGSASRRSTTAWPRSAPPDRRAEPRRRDRQAFGPQAGLDIVLPLFDVAELRQYHLLPAVAATCSAAPGAWSRPEALPPGGIVDQQHPGTRDHAASRGGVRPNMVARALSRWVIDRAR